MTDSTSARLPRPFYDRPWPASLQPHARALWQWHLALRERAAAGTDVSFEEAAEQVEQGAPVTLLPETVWQPAYAACREHRLAFALLAEQVRAAAMLAVPVRFDTAAAVRAFVTAWAAPHARLLAGLADAGRTWQLAWIDALAAGFFWVGRIVSLPEELERDWLFFPMAELEQEGVTIEQLRRGAVDEAVRRLLWKQSVRARDALARGSDLVRDLPRPYAGALKRYWFGALEVLREVERRDYDVWTRPITLSAFTRLQIQYQSRFGRTTFRA